MIAMLQERREGSDIFELPYADTRVVLSRGMLRGKGNRWLEETGRIFRCTLHDAQCAEPAMGEEGSDSPGRSTPHLMAVEPFRTGMVIRFPDLAEFFVSEDGFAVDVRPQVSVDAETIHHLLLDKVLPLVLAHQGRLVVHAGAVEVDDGLVAFLGPQGAGKSTLTAALAGLGKTLLTDDCILIEIAHAEALGIPTYPSLRLWRDSLKHLYPGGRATVRMAQYSNKRRDIAPQELSPRLWAWKKVKALYVLQPCRQCSTQDVSFEKLSQRDAFVAVLSNAFFVKTSSQLKPCSLEARIAELVSLVPVFGLEYPHRFGALEATSAATLRHLSQW